MTARGPGVAVLGVLVVVVVLAPGAMAGAHASSAILDESSASTNGTSGQGAGTPDIQVQPEALRFPNETYGTPTRDLTVRNVGDAPLTIRSVDIVGPHQGSFDRDVSEPIRIEPAEERTVSVSFDASTDRPRAATMHILSDDPDEPQRNVWLTNTQTVANVSPSRVLERKTLVNATVRNAEANTTHAINVSWPLTRDDIVAVDALSFTPTRDGDVTLSVATNTSRFGEVPTFDLDDGTEPAGYIHVDHSITNEDVKNATFTVRVRKDRLADEETGPEDVALYRYESGSWTELPTRIVTEGDTHYFFEAEAPGLSDFATGIKQAKFEITDAVVTVTEITTDEGTTVLVRVRNVGGADGTYAVKLLLQDEVVDRQELSIAPNGTRQATFERTFDDPGVYDVYVNERFVGNVTVGSTSSGTTEGGQTSTTAVDESSVTRPLPGFDVGTALVSLVVVVLLVVIGRSSRRSV